MSERQKGRPVPHFGWRDRHEPRDASSIGMGAEALQRDVRDWFGYGRLQVRAAASAHALQPRSLHPLRMGDARNKNNTEEGNEVGPPDSNVPGRQPPTRRSELLPFMASHNPGTDPWVTSVDSDSCRSLLSGVDQQAKYNPAKAQDAAGSTYR